MPWRGLRKHAGAGDAKRLEIESQIGCGFELRARRFELDFRRRLLRQRQRRRLILTQDAAGIGHELRVRCAGRERRDRD
jgi:hypothetical protein